MDNVNDRQNNDEISMLEIKQKLSSLVDFFRKKWLKLLIGTMLGGILGFGYAYLQPKYFKAKLSFVVEESKSAGGSLAALAGQFGFDLGGAGSNGLLSGENLLLFLKSNSLCKEVLLTSYDSIKNYSLADMYADEYELREKWKRSKKVGTLVYFPVNTTTKYSRLQDSLVQVLIDKILKKELKVERPEKKASFINVQVTMRNELLAKFFCERLVNKATERYIYTKTKRQKTNVDRLQKRADSIGAILNYKTFINASEMEKILDVNPGSKTTTVDAEISSREKLMLSTIYGEVVKNLEIAKVQLSQETPTIQMVDEVSLPVEVIKTSKILFMLFFMLLFLIVEVAVLKMKNY